MSDDHFIQATVLRLSRPHPSGGRVIERASVLSVGPEAAAIMRWITEHGVPEELVARGGEQGIHGTRSRSGIEESDTRKPLRYVLSAEALTLLDAPPDAE
ncbi:MAG: hypothetical protein ACJ762_20270 [Solirubrobacteraceae bacterium]